MNTQSSAVRHFVLTAAILAATLGLAPALALAQRGGPPPAPQAPSPAAAFNDGAGWLGISMSEVTPQKAQEVGLNDVHGVEVTGVTENSPAAKAGLAGGDIITDFRGQRVEGMLELSRLVRETPPGRTVQLRVWRDRRSRDIPVEIGRSSRLLSGDFLPPDFQDRVRQFQDRMQRRFQDRDGQGRQGQGPRAAVLGVTVQDVSGQFGDYLKVPDGQGVLITSVRAGSAAEKGGLHTGDVIISVDGQRIHNTGELRAQMRGTQPRTVALRVIRNGAEMTVNVEISAAPGRGANNRSSIPI